MPIIGVKRDLLFKALGQEYSKLLVPNQDIYVETYNEHRNSFAASEHNFIINNRELFQTGPTLHSVHTRNKNHLHILVTDLSYFQKGVLCWHQNLQ